MLSGGGDPEPAALPPGPHPHPQPRRSPCLSQALSRLAWELRTHDQHQAHRILIRCLTERPLRAQKHCRCPLSGGLERLREQTPTSSLRPGEQSPGTDTTNCKARLGPALRCIPLPCGSHRLTSTPTHGSPEAFPFFPPVLSPSPTSSPRSAFFQPGQTQLLCVSFSIFSFSCLFRKQVLLCHNV